MHYFIFFVICLGKNPADLAIEMRKLDILRILLKSKTIGKDFFEELLKKVVTKETWNKALATLIYSGIKVRNLYNT